jgi:hypothetical protein
MELPRGIDPRLLHKPLPSIEHPNHDIADGNYFEGAEDDTVPTPPQTPEDSKSSPTTSYDQESSHSTESDDRTEQTRRSKRERPTSDLALGVAKRPKLSDGIPDEVWDRPSLHRRLNFARAKIMHCQSTAATRSSLAFWKSTHFLLVTSTPSSWIPQPFVRFQTSTFQFAFIQCNTDCPSLK